MPGILLLLGLTTCPVAEAQGLFEDLMTDTARDRQRLENVRITVADEKQFGDQIFDQFTANLNQQGIRVTDQGRDAKYLTAITSLLREQMQHSDRYPKIRVFVADTEWTDAKSFPGGRIIVFAGLLDFAESEAAMAGVLAHELSHIDRGHQLDILRRIQLARQTMHSGRFHVDEWMQTGRLIAQYFARPFRPEQESEADADAVRWMVATRYDAIEFARLFERFHQRDGRGRQGVPDFLKTHPLHQDRDRAVRRQLRQLPVGRREAPMYRGRENLKRRIPRSVRRFDE